MVNGFATKLLGADSSGYGINVVPLAIACLQLFVMPSVLPLPSSLCSPQMQRSFSSLPRRRGGGWAQVCCLGRCCLDSFGLLDPCFCVVNDHAICQALSQLPVQSLSPSLSHQRRLLDKINVIVLSWSRVAVFVAAKAANVFGRMTNVQFLAGAEPRDEGEDEDSLDRLAEERWLAEYRSQPAPPIPEVVSVSY